MLEEIDGNKECQLISIFKALEFFNRASSIRCSLTFRRWGNFFNVQLSYDTAKDSGKTSWNERLEL